MLYIHPFSTCYTQFNQLTIHEPGREMGKIKCNPILKLISSTFNWRQHAAAMHVTEQPDCISASNLHLESASTCTCFAQCDVVETMKTHECNVFDGIHTLFFSSPGVNILTTLKNIFFKYASIIFLHFGARFKIKDTIIIKFP